MRSWGKALLVAAAAACASAFIAPPRVSAAPFFFNTGDPDGKMATLTQPGTLGKLETESADDFILGSETLINHATFTGLLTGGATLANIGEVRVEIYRVFPNDSNTVRPITVPTRANSPSDVEFVDRDTASANLTFTASVLNGGNPFAALNSVTNGIHPSPNQHTGGDGPVSGTEVKFDVNFTTPFDLPADHYFFVPQVEITTPNGGFLWLSAPKPITGPGTTPFVGDLQSWIRNENLAPDWLRIGTDIVDGTAAPAPQFNASFSLDGETPPGGGGGVPLPAALPASLPAILCMLAWFGVQRRRAV
jgi:hypothetical protein